MASVQDITAPAKPEGPVRTLIRTFGLFRRVMDPFFTRHGLSHSQWSVLRALSRVEDEGVTTLRLTDLSNRLLIRPPSVTGVVDRLNRLGLLQRCKSADDHRAKEVSLTPAGRERVQQVLAQLPEQLESVLTDLNAGERVQLQNLLRKLSSRLEILSAEIDENEERAQGSPAQGSEETSP